MPYHQIVSLDASSIPSTAALYITITVAELTSYTSSSIRRYRTYRIFTRESRARNVANYFRLLSHSPSQSVNPRAKICARQHANKPVDEDDATSLSCGACADQ